MDHLIRFTTAEGVEGTHHAGSLEDAVAFVERLRNTEEAADVRLFRLTEVPIEFRTYYRVEVSGVIEHEQAAGPSGGIGADPLTSADPSGPPPVPTEMGPRLVPNGSPDHGANGRRLFSR